MPTVGRQTQQLCARKVGYNEARSLSHTFGKHELNLGIVDGGLNRSTQHFILAGKDGVWNETEIS